MEDYKKELELIKKEIDIDYENQRPDDTQSAMFHILGILEIGQDIVTRNHAIKYLSNKSGIDSATLKSLYIEENRKRINIQSRKTPIPKEYMQFSLEILSLLASQNIDNKNKALEKLSFKFLELNHVVSIRDSKSEEMWIYKEGVYIPHGETYVMEFSRMILGHAYEQRIVNNVISKIRSDTFIDAETFFNSQNQDPYIIPVLNGLLDLQTKKLMPFNPQKFFFNKLNVEYEEGVDCPKIQSFIRSLVSTDEDLEVLQEFFGFCLIKKYSFKKGLMLEGSGDNGKSALMKLFRNFIGLDNITSVSLQKMNQDQYIISEFHNKLVNINADLSSQDVEDTGMFRELTGNDYITANRKFLSHIKFVNYAKMIFLANELPMPRDMVDAFFNRWIIIRFPYKFLSEEFIDVNNPLHKLKDEDVVDKLFDKSEFSGFLNWIIKGLYRLEINKEFSKAKSVQEVKYEWMSKSNSFIAFANDELVDSDDTHVLISDLRKAYTLYCKSKGLKPVSDRVIKTFVTKELGASESRPYHCGVQKRAYFGVGFKNGATVNFDGGLFSCFNSQKVLNSGLVDSEAGFVNSNSFPVSPTIKPFKARKSEVEDLSDPLISDIEVKALTDEYDEELKDNVLFYLSGKDLVPVEVLISDLGLHEFDVDALIRKGFIFEPKAGYVRLIE